MVEIRVAVPDATRAHGLMRRLAELFGRSSVSFDGLQTEVRVCSEWGSRNVVQVLSAVESWLAEDDRDSVKLSIGDRSYTIVCPGAPGNPEPVEHTDGAHRRAHRADDGLGRGSAASTILATSSISPLSRLTGLTSRRACARPSNRFSMAVKESIPWSA
jgi:hypothetical protein